ncbi:acyl-CoA dehydrogenase NM domain-like protein [Flagelloscypha sp. PMI_526]|nr:acyl-CoA dehydrogenase NM domain-like protein [Flagelloscypha sp. PMI_526]
MRIEQGFQPQVWVEENAFLDDPVLPHLLQRLLHSNTRPVVEADLTRFSVDLNTKIRPHLPPLTAPSITQYDQLGRRIDNLQTSEAWRILQDHSIREGLVSLGYERDTFGASARVYQFAKLMLSVGDFQVVDCPFAMTDGVARVLELSGSSAMKDRMLPRLLSRDPSKAYLGGQWMTERPGGSDVSQTETTAAPTSTTSNDIGSAYLLDGFKWFSSAAEGHVSVALARTGSPDSGSRGLSLFLVPLRVEGHASTPLQNGIHIHRLKNKFGTHGLPTAELSLNGARGWLLGKENNGVKLITPVLNITRVHSAIGSVGCLRRGLSIARAYAAVRTIHGGKTLLKDSPLHMQMLADLTVLYKGLVHLVFGAVSLLGKVECSVASEEENHRLRLLTPAVKAYAANHASPALLECMAALGGLGYMEETGIGRLIRDSSVEKIWEGTANVLALDVLRASKDPKAIQSYVTWANNILSAGGSVQGIQTARTYLQSIVTQLPSLLSTSSTNPLLPVSFMTILASTSAALYLLEQVIWAVAAQPAHASVDIVTFNRWVLERDLEGLIKQVGRVKVGDVDVKKRVGMDLDLVYSKL